MANKYILLKDDTRITKNGTVLYRIKRQHDGLLGGYIESEKNLSQNNSCFVYGNARVYGNAVIFGNARVSDNALVCGNAHVYGDAKIYDNAYICGNARVSNNAHVSGNAWVHGNAFVYGNASVYGNAKIYDNAYICGNAYVSGDAIVCGKDIVRANEHILKGKVDNNNSTLPHPINTGVIFPDPNSFITNQTSSCDHSWLTYDSGFSAKYDFCSKCNIKKDSP